MTEPLDLFDCATELTPRQWGVYNLIKKNSLLGKKTTQREIFENVVGFTWNDEPTSHDHCPAIWQEITILNLSYEIEKIIISKNFEYWIGDENETKEFIDDLWKQLEPRLYRFWRYKSKVSENGQGQLLSRRLKPIDEKSKAREYIESFITIN